MMDNERLKRLLTTNSEDVVKVMQKFHSPVTDPELELALIQLGITICLGSKSDPSQELANLVYTCLETAFNMGVQWNEANRR